MKKILYVILFITLINCKGDKEMDNNKITLSVRVVNSDVKNHSIGLDDYPLYSGIKSLKVASVMITNLDNEDIYIYNKYKNHFLTATNHSTNHPIYSSSGYRESCKIFLAKLDSIAIYVSYEEKADTLFMNMLWKKSELGFDELKFYKNNQGIIKYHSYKEVKIEYKRKENLKAKVNTFSDCGTLSKKESY